MGNVDLISVPVGRQVLNVGLTSGVARSSVLHSNGDMEDISEELYRVRTFVWREDTKQSVLLYHVKRVALKLRLLIRPNPCRSAPRHSHRRLSPINSSRTRFSVLATMRTYLPSFQPLINLLQALSTKCTTSFTILSSCVHDSLYGLLVKTVLITHLVVSCLLHFLIGNGRIL